MKKLRAFALSAFLLISGLISIAWITPMSIRLVLLELLYLAIVVPICIRILRANIDLFEPAVMTSFVLALMFVARPLSDVALDNYEYLGYNIGTVFNETLFVALIGIISFQIGYYLPGLERLYSYIQYQPSIIQSQKIALAGFFYFTIGGLLFFTFLKQHGGIGFLLYLMVGRQVTDNAIFLSSTGYIYNGILMWGASALIFFSLATAWGKKIYWPFFLSITAMLLIFFGARGARSHLLPLVLAIPVFWYLWKDRRPKLRTIILAFYFGVAFIGWIREVRHVDHHTDVAEKLSRSLLSPIDTTNAIISGADNGMFDALACELIVVPELLPYQTGSTVTDIFVRAIPRTVWGEKPLEASDAVINTLWPDHYSKNRASSATTIIGPLFADTGIFTVFTGMLSIGAVLKLSWIWFMQYRAFIIAQLIYSMGLPFIIILLRGSFPDTLSRMLFLFIPIILLQILARTSIFTRKSELHYE